MDVVKIGLAGYGTVGTGLAKILDQNQDWIIKRIGKKVVIDSILVKNLAKKRSFVPVNAPLFLDDSKQFLARDWDILVELIGGVDFAFYLIEQALTKARPVVTANKALLALKGEQVLSLAQQNKVGLGFEASVAGGIPIVQTLKTSLAGNKIDHLLGILNGTANYILSEMTQNGLEFEQALKQAQDLGFAEADPSFDVEGIDAGHKLVILIFLSQGIFYPFDSLEIKGIKQILPKDILFARELGFVFKLIAQVKNKKGSLQAGVFPALLPQEHILAKVEGAFNAVLVEGNAVGPIMLYGQGAGDLPTGSAVLADILTLIKQKHLDNTGFVNFPLAKAKTLDYDFLETEFYLRFKVVDRPGVLSCLSGVMGKYQISIAQAIQKVQKKDKGVPIVFLTHKAKWGDLKQAIDEINKFDFILKPTICYPILK